MYYFHSKISVYLFCDNTFQCDSIVHLAAMNRHPDPQVIYNTNLDLVKKLLISVENTNHSPHIIFSSSIQEERDNPYGKSKKQGRLLFEKASQSGEIDFTGLLIPNVFGPFGRPFYNSVISTFSHQVANNEIPKIEIDASLKLIYINDLVKIIFSAINKEFEQQTVHVNHKHDIKVSEILDKLQKFKSEYIDNNIIPKLKDDFDISLFNTFRTYIPENHYPVKLQLHQDDRGQLCEIIKSNISGQCFYSSTKPGITRGNHYHSRKIERFCVVGGKASIKLRRIGTNKIIEYIVDGKQPSIIDMPVFHTHNITNIGNNELLTLFWTNEFFDPKDPDTFYETV